mgnify:FL=1
MKKLILCADDYALSPMIDEGIRALVIANRLSAISCITNSPCWPEASAKLKPLSAEIQVGLHFNLTATFETPAYPLWKLIRDCLLGLFDEKQYTCEFHRQLESFEYFWGKKPDFVDGHQHIHIFPTIRNIVIRVLAERYSHADRPWVRRVNSPLTGHDALLKALILRILGLGFSHAVRRTNIPLSGDFYGLYSLSPNADFQSMVTGWIQTASDQAIIMCPPAIEPSDALLDSIDQARINEFNYLTGKDFSQFCKKESVFFNHYEDCPARLNISQMTDYESNFSCNF